MGKVWQRLVERVTAPVVMSSPKRDTNLLGDDFDHPGEPGRASRHGIPIALDGQQARPTERSPTPNPPKSTTPTRWPSGGASRFSTERSV